MEADDPKEREKELKKYARSIGCSSSSLHQQIGEATKFKEDEVIRRIRDAETANRAGKLYWLALFSALASICSAIAAWIAVSK